MRLLVGVVVGLLFTGACSASGDDAPPALSEGFFTARDQDAAFPLVALKKNGRVLYSYAVYQYACGDTLERTFRTGGTIRPVPADTVPLVAIANEVESATCGIVGTAQATGETGIEVEVVDPATEEVSTIALERIKRDEFLDEFNAFEFPMPATAIPREQDNFCNALFHQPCATYLKGSEP